jgi:hypothetical protein
MGRVFEFLPLVKRNPAAYHDMFGLGGRVRWKTGNDEQGDGKEARHGSGNLPRKLSQGKPIRRLGEMEWRRLSEL